MRTRNKIRLRGTDLHSTIREEETTRLAVEDPDLMGDGGWGRRIGVLGKVLHLGR